MKVEWFDEVFEWKNPEDLYKVCIIQQKEIERLHSIIKEVREYVKKENHSNWVMYGRDEILEILDKENK